MDHKDWEYNSTHDIVGQDNVTKTYHVWERKHHEGYNAYALTLQPKVGFNKPTGTGHYTGEHALKNKTGIVVVSNNQP